MSEHRPVLYNLGPGNGGEVLACDWCGQAWPCDDGLDLSREEPE